MANNYYERGDRLNILLADELPETWTGTQDTQHICGKCVWYSFLKLESICRKTGKEVAYFANRECFTTDKYMDMEENNNAKPVAETGTQVCKECGRTLPLEDFQRRRNGNVDNVCKACRAEKARIGIARKKAVKVEIPEKIAKAVSAPSPASEAVLEEAVKTERPSVEEVLTKAGLKPYKDGNQWCVLAGDNLQEGICGFGDTIEDALYEFLIDVLNTQKEQKPEVISQVTYVADFSDAALLDELRRRGYKGRISKCEEVEI